MLLLRGAIFRKAILFRPMIPFVPERLPDLSDVRVLISAGDQDPIVASAETQRLAALLRKSAADVSVVSANAGHGLLSGEVQSASFWLQEFHHRASDV